MEQLARLDALYNMNGGGLGLALLFGLLAAGAAGSVLHCTAMCGPFVLGQVSDRLARLPAARLCETARWSNALLLPYHAGRLTTYAVLGAVASQAGAASKSGLLPGSLPALLLLFGALLFVCHALVRVAPALRPVLPVLERAPPGLAYAVRRLAAPAGRRGSGFLLGACLGFLPCGFLYAAIAVAASTASVTCGTLAMLVFGLGTMPGLVIVGVAGHAAGRGFYRAVAVVAPLIMLGNAALLGTMAWRVLAALA